MNALPSPASPPLFVFQILGNRAGVPSGLLLALPPCSGDAAAHALADAHSTSLAADFPCFYAAGLDSAVLRPLVAARWRELPERSICRLDEKLAPNLLAPGAQWVVGDWCMAAPPVPAPAQAASRAMALQLLGLVAADADTREIETLLRRDPTLSYQLLRLVNSLGMGVGRRITSFSQALLILGRQQLRRWLNLMLFAARPGDMRSPMLLARVAVRARAIELLARARGLDKLTQEQAFMTGMFSLLGVLFGMSLADLLAPLSLGEAVHDALLDGAGELGALLALVEVAEAARFDALAAQLDALQLGAGDVNAIMVEANRWMLGAVAESRGQRYA